ncbi:MAG: CDP-diacylglycerol--glycerol-3-phosphate 3-phosphatidyltransferase [Lachnospiraceae bacterium]|jgi:CDP-diacylglycerol--glycerol-3-phosphate 3-phosphatidyltransferase|nr:MAG: CDP-diacylglycerol--glycerol-3-phosphate 3-phosphatidyltransferase [Lachnospiraceae bacterium]
MNLANKLTMLRILMIPVFIAVLVYSKDRDIVYRYIALGIFIIASATDALDGYVARKYNMITDFGKLMDPLADKILVSSALIILIELGNISSWVVSIVIAREFIISGIRLIATEKNIIIAASPLGKLKTVSQMLSVILMLLSIEAISFITDISVWLMCILSVVSLLDYIIKNKKVLSLGGM